MEGQRGTDSGRSCSGLLWVTLVAWRLDDDALSPRREDVWLCLRVEHCVDWGGVACLTPSLLEHGGCGRQARSQWVLYRSYDLWVCSVAGWRRVRGFEAHTSMAPTAGCGDSHSLPHGLSRLPRPIKEKRNGTVVW
jgi:hypothetical protein